MVFESLQLNIGRARHGSGGSLHPAALTEESLQHANAASLIWELAPKQTMTGIQVFLGEILNPPNSAAFQVLADMGCHAQLVTTRPPGVALLVQPGGERVH